MLVAGLSGMWTCKGCTLSLSSRSELLSHYKLKHPQYGSTARFPCTHPNCPCTFKTWNALKIHQSRIHSSTAKQTAIFSCHHCTCSGFLSQKDFFAHIYGHLQSKERVTCMFLGCDFATNLYGNFRSHKSRKHRQYKLEYFKPGIISNVQAVPEYHENFEEDSDTPVPSTSPCETEDLRGVVEKSFAAALLKLEHLVHLPGTALDVFLGDLSHLICSASMPLSYDGLKKVLLEKKLPAEKLLVEDLVNAVCSGNPVLKSIQKGGPLSTVYMRKKFYKEMFKVVEPVEYILDAKNKRSFQYVPILESLCHLLERKEVADHVTGHLAHEATESQFLYKSLKDGSLYKENTFFNVQDPRVVLSFYVDDFEVCNPLGTSRRKHKLCAVYWILANLPPGSHSSLSSIYLSVLCKSEDVKTYGFNKVLEPLLEDLKTLER